MREGEDAAAVADFASTTGTAEPVATEEDEPEAPPTSLTGRVITGAYVIFAAMLMAILWCLQST
jgi:hypothetical protein